MHNQQSFSSLVTHLIKVQVVLEPPVFPGLNNAESIFASYLERFGSTTLGKLSKLRRTQSIPTSLLSLIF